MQVFFEGFQIQVCFSDAHQQWFSEIALAETNFRFHEYEHYANTESECLLDSLKACQLICLEQTKPDFMLPSWPRVEAGEF